MTGLYCFKVLLTFSLTVLMRTFVTTSRSTVKVLPVKHKSTPPTTMQPVLNMAIKASADSGCHENWSLLPMLINLEWSAFKRTNGWVTSYNPAIAYCIRSNHDIIWILSSSSKALAYVYYLTNYATKADISPQQILVKGANAMIADSIKSGGGNISSTDNLEQDSKFLLRWYNSLSYDQEISYFNSLPVTLIFRSLCISIFGV